MTTPKDIVVGLIAHSLIALSIVADYMRRDSDGIAETLFAVAGASLILPALVFFMIHPRSFFLLSARSETWDAYDASMARRAMLCVLSWLFLISWVVGFFAFSHRLPAYVKFYVFLLGVMLSILVSRFLFPRKDM